MRRVGIRALLCDICLFLARAAFKGCCRTKLKPVTKYPYRTLLYVISLCILLTTNNSLGVKAATRPKKNKVEEL